jgi:hypothetical protein
LKTTISSKLNPIQDQVGKIHNFSGSYDIRRDKQEGTAKTMLGGSLETKPLIDNGVPGPGTYNPDSRVIKPGEPGFKYSKLSNFV